MSPPCKSETLIPSSSNSSATLSTPALVLQNTIDLPNVFITSLVSSDFIEFFVNQKKCFIESILISLGPTSILDGLCWYFLINLATSSSNVALNKMVCLSLAHSSKMSHTGSIKPMSAILSASSITTISVSSRLNAF